MDSVLIATEDDEQRSYVVGLLEENEKWTVRSARNGRESLDILSTEKTDLLLTDGKLPDVSAGDFLTELRRRYPGLPVVLLTTKGPNEALVGALRLGAASYVPRSSMARDLVSTVSRVLALCERYKLDPQLLACRTSSQTSFVLGHDAALFQSVVAFIQDELERFHGCTPSERVNVGIAVEEALLNAMVHGNLEIGPEIREEGLRAYEARIAERREATRYKDRKITLQCTFSPHDVRIRVRDEGPGFDMTTLPDPTHPENLAKSGGRGLLLIRSFMDEIQFNEKGNEIEMVKKRRQT